MRLDKYLVDCGIGSRTEVKQLLKKKLITVNSKVETSPKMQVDEKTDQIAYQGQELNHETFVYYLLNKPKGVISATEDPQHRTVLDLLDDRARQKQVFPVGRLDKDTHGLLLLTNHGELAHALLSPKRHVDKEYIAEVAGIMTEVDKKSFADGIVLKDHTCQPAKLDILEVNAEENTCRVRITIREGKFHQVKRMVAACGKEVTDLQRIRMGNLVLPEDLALGEWRRLTDEEQEALAPYGIEK